MGGAETVSAEMIGEGGGGLSRGMIGAKINRG
jgi:hypothetical protein